MDAISEKKKMGRRGFGPNSTYSFAVKSPAGGWGTREGRGLCQYFFLVQTPFPPPPHLLSHDFGTRTHNPILAGEVCIYNLER